MIGIVTPAAPPFQPFLLEHRAAVLRLVVGMVGPSDADDCFQDAFCRALRAWPPAETGDRLGAWMLTIAHRTALDHLRRRSRGDVPTDELGELVAPSVPSTDAPPAELWAAVRGLPEKQRACVVLRIVLDQSHAQVAELLDCSEAAARRSYADGLAALRGQVDDGRLEVTR
jgi:RNA polymerase sigma factor (sigma-70 family)